METTAPTLVIEPPRGWLRVNWRELWLYRELLFFLSWRDVTVRYKQAVLGVAWALIQPLLRLVIFSFIFGRVARLDSEGFPYPIFLYAGMLPWQFFSEALNRSSGSVIGSSTLITRVYFPRLIIPLSSIGSCLADFLISFAILGGLMVYYGVLPGWGLLALPPLILAVMLAALGVGIFLSAMTVAFRDFKYVVPFALQIWMYLTPVVYPVRAIPERWRWLLALNPMTGIVDGFRSALLGKPWDPGNLAASGLVTLAVLVFSLYFFRRLESRFADII